VPSTWGDLRGRYGGKGPPQPLFVKLLHRNKAFPAIALYNPEDVVSATNVADSEEVLVAEYVVFVSEWRCYVCNGAILELCHYQGDPFTYPDPRVIQEALADYGPHAPSEAHPCKHQTPQSPDSVSFRLGTETSSQNIVRHRRHWPRR
jgi:hypothetical protein